ncbi:LCP family protein [Nocardioides sp. CBS4Y-1]|uniref:LCP family protein n=2 Tax=Nocardioides acrostichi TaxID=2784339 RepID=A0A930Y901_9ACTN|nr:LCP family protein [Nocardioides acrostichi]
MISALSVIYLYRHYNGNLTVIDINDQMVGPRPDKVDVQGPQDPLNVLIMGSDSRDGKGNDIDGLTGGGQRSDTTILLHLSADRTRAYGISIPRDLMVDRPACKTSSGTQIPAATYQMWNAAFQLAGPACTVSQFESLTGIRLDHFVVVDFEGFQGMVDAVGGVQVCIPETIDDRAHGIYLEAGTRKLEGRQALNYVRERYAVSGGSDVGRMKRQQAFIASMAHQVLSSDTLAHPTRLLGFLDSATKSLTLDDGLGNLAKIAQLGYEFRGISLDDIQFITSPIKTDPQDPNRLVWKRSAKVMWRRIREDEPLTKRLQVDVISAASVPGQSDPSESPSESASESPSESPSASSSGGAKGGNGGNAPTASNEALAAAGLCTS